MKANKLGEGSHLLDDAFKKIKPHGLLRADDLRAKTALEIADVADFDIDFRELFKHFGLVNTEAFCYKENMDNKGLPQKIAVVGNAGGGKTTLSRRLAAIYGLPLTHVDSIQFVAGMRIRPYAESIAILEGIQQGPAWIIDGYGPLDIIEKRFALADQVLFIDFPLWHHYWWCAKRQIQNLWSRREELPADCDELTWTHTLKLFKTMKKMHQQMRPELLRIFSRDSLKDKVVFVRRYEDWQRIFHRGFEGK